jgi:phosphatidylserine/phosphatidylglycerophosphate/cardiolipin synthase-like enzyme
MQRARMPQWALLLAMLWALLCLGGCATSLPAVERQPSFAVAAPTGAPLPQLAAEAAVPEGRSGFWPMPQSAFALDARLTLIRQARSSLDLQYYLIGNDTIGRLVLRELRDAAQRGVRVRLLVDDLYTAGMDPLLLGLAAHRNVQVRLFNPFTGARQSSFGRFLSFAGNFKRLNHRMHNKLFIADGTFAVVGGRNLADEYFLRSKEANFVDFDLLAAGTLVPDLEKLFDRYWNSEEVYPLTAIASTDKTAQALRDDFEDATAEPTDPATLPPAEPDLFGQPCFSAELAAHHVRLLIADSTAYADTPEKAAPDPHDFDPRQTVTSRFIGLLHEARHEVFLFSPYFIPGKKGLQRLKEARDAGVEVRIVTNAMGASDEPLVGLGYRQYRTQMLAMGVKLYEISSSRLTHDPTLKRLLGQSRGRLHAKMGFIDRQTVLVGSMNLDPRSAYTNTEIGVAVHSPELAQMILKGYKVDSFAGVYEVQLKPDGSSVQWRAKDENGEEVLQDEPDLGPWDRMKAWMLYLFVPEDLL